MQESWAEWTEEQMNVPNRERPIESSASMIRRVATQSRCSVNDRSSVE